MSHDVVVDYVPSRPTAVVTATTSWQAFPTLWPELLGEVWACLRAGGRVVASSMPAGRVATTTHRGPWSGLGSAHQAVSEWCIAQGWRPAGPRWEVYGPHRDHPTELWTQVYWLLSDQTSDLGTGGRGRPGLR